MVQIMNYFGEEIRHLIVSMNDETQASIRLNPGVPFQLVSNFGTSNPFRAFRRLSNLFAQERPDLVLTYNWGAIDAVPAAWIQGIPVIHSEDGFGADEATKQKPRRVWYRRVVLRTAKAVVAPSHNLRKLITGDWSLPRKLLSYIPNGVDTELYSPAGTLDDARAKIAIGTAGHLRLEKNQGALIRAFATASRQIGERSQLLISGEGAERSRLQKEIEQTGLTGSAHLLGHIDQMNAFYRRLDIFALSSLTEQMPVCILEAMASGLPIVSTRVGDIPEMVADENRPFLVSNDQDLASAMVTLAKDPELRKRIGEANRRRAVEHYALECMLKAYRALYSSWLNLRR
jgi:glycosyltransferase involved in cell wall biosynthesis